MILPSHLKEGLKLCLVAIKRHKVEQYVYCQRNSIILFDGSHNTGTNFEALYLENQVYIFFNGSISVTFINNSAETGGAIYAGENCSIETVSHSQVNFISNQADLNGGAIGTILDCNISFTAMSVISFINNSAGQDGAALHSILMSVIDFRNSSYIMFASNLAIQYGGAIHLFMHGNVTFEGYSSVTFCSNTVVEQGGAIHSTRQSTISSKESSQVVFKDNKADIGGAIASCYDSLIYFGGENSTILHYLVELAISPISQHHCML